MFIFFEVLGFSVAPPKKLLFTFGYKSKMKNNFFLCLLVKRAVLKSKNVSRETFLSLTGEILSL